MVEHPKTVSAKLDYIMQACGITAKSNFAKAIGVEPQNVENWRKRNSITKDAVFLLAKRTGVSIDWLLDLSAIAFPNGVKLKQAASIEQLVGRNEADIDQARNAMGALLEALESKLQGITAAFDEALDAVAPSEGYSEKGFHGLLAAFVKHKLETAAMAQPSAPVPAAPMSVSRKRAK